MNRRDFLLLKTRGQERVLELSCERLYMRHTDAKSGALRASGGSGDPESWEGEPPLEMVTPTTDDLLRELDEELASADVLHVLDRDWLVAGAFRGAVEARIDAFRRRGGRVEYPASARRAVRSVGGGLWRSLQLQYGDAGCAPRNQICGARGFTAGSQDRARSEFTGVW